MYKKFMCTLCAALFAATMIPSSYAVDQSTLPIAVESNSESDIIPHADVIVYKYRIHNGVHQYRRWNETRGYWVDPYWINL